jgi:hypothetical protein
MKRKINYICLICGLATGLWGSIAISDATAGNPATGTIPGQRSPVMDIALRDNATLIGHIIAPDGTPLPNRTVTLFSGTKNLQTTKSDAAGYFVFREASTGSLSIKSGDFSQHLRVWTRTSAPPIAQADAKLICGPTVRGQFGSTIGGITAPSIHPVQYLRHPATVAGVIGLAIAAPLAIHEELAPLPATVTYSPSLSSTPSNGGTGP